MSGVESWAGSMSALGPIYPFVGTEFGLCLIGLVLWITWHIWQSRIENKEYAQELERYAGPNTLARVLELEQDPESTHFHE